MEPGSPALAGGVFTSEPPGKTRECFLNFSESSILTYYGITTVFCILILYPATLLNLFYSNRFLFFFNGVFGIFYRYNMSSANSGSFTSSFLVWIPFLSCPTAMARSPNTVLSKSGVREHSCLVPHLRRDFSFAPLSMMLAVDLACVHACYATSVMSDSPRPCELQPARLLCLWGFSRQEYWSELPCPPPGIIPTQGSNPRLLSPALVGAFFFFGRGGGRKVLYH